MSPTQMQMTSMAQAILPEFDHEMELTRKSLERVPGDRLDFRPHPKSYTMKALANHLAVIPNWGATTLENNSFDVAPEGQTMAMPSADTPAGIVEMFDKHVTQMRALLEKTSDEAFMQQWSLLAGGRTMFTMPRIAVLRGMILSHMIHHRAQLGVYLRLCDVPVPAIYGPSADES